MRNRATALAGAALVAAFALAGCGPDKPATKAGGTPVAITSSAPATTPADPAAELAAAAAGQAKQSMRVSMTMGKTLAMSGVVDAAAGKADMVMDMSTSGRTMKIDVRRLGRNFWMRFEGELGGLSGHKWMHLDTATVQGGGGLLSGGDPAQAAKTVKAMVHVQKVGDHEFTGTLDLTRAQTVPKSALKDLGAKAKAVPFTAKTDARGRLVEMSVDMSKLAPGEDLGVMTTRYSDFGTPVTVHAPPASQVTELPKSLSGILKS
jgi:hypothetical protein